MFREGDQLGPYTLVSKIGSGAFGTVWLADRVTQITTTRVALKLPSGADVDVEAIRHEANTWVQASGHPNVVPIIEANIYDGQVIIASEYIAEGSLEDWLHANGGRAPSLEVAIDMTRGILAGLEHLHSRHIIHRDLKPANLLLQGETARLADFGISRVLNTASRTAMAAGTPSYMAPEAFDGKRNEQTDLWAVGVMLYQMAAGRLPFPQQEMTSLIGAIVSRNPEPLPAFVPAPLQAVISCALAKNPAQRYRSASEMRAALRNAAKQLQEGHQPAPQPPRPMAATLPQHPPFTNPGNVRPAPFSQQPVGPTMPVVHSYPPQPHYPQYPQPGYQPAPPKGRSPMVYVVIALIAALVIGGGVFAFLKLRNGSTTPSNTNNSLVAAANTNNATTNTNTRPAAGNANTTPIEPIRVSGSNVYKLETAGLQFEKPAGWNQEVQDGRVQITSPDGSLSIIFMVVEQEENLQAAVTALGQGLESAMDNVQTDGEMKQDTHNGMTVYSQSGSGVADGITLYWGADIVMADKPVIVLTTADRSKSSKYTNEIQQFINSIKRTS